MVRSARIPASAIGLALAGLTLVAGGPRLVTAETPPAVVATLDYVAGSTRKLEQLIDDWDQHLQCATRNQTCQRFGIRGTDLGFSFEHEGRLVFLFGDTIGPGNGDPLAVSQTTDPEHGLSLDFFRADDGTYLQVAPPGIRMGGFEVPAAGISIGGKIYIFCTTDHTPAEVMGRSVLVEFNESDRSFRTIRDVSRRPGNFVNVAPHLAPMELAGLPGGEVPQVLIWGSGAYRRSHVYLSCVPAAQIEQPAATRYFTGCDPQGHPVWSGDESAAAPVVEHAVVGELSVTWCTPLRIWLMTYNSVRPRGILLRWSSLPWGPWSKPVAIFRPFQDGGYGKFMRIGRPGLSHGPAGPVAVPQGDPQRIWGGEYGPYVIERFTRVEDSVLTIYYTMSTWNPYTVVLMRSQLRITCDEGAADR